MRSFKSKLLSAGAFAVPVLSAVIPHAERREVARSDGKLLQLGMNTSYTASGLPSVGTC
jgi:hypothetical protein